MRRLHSDAVLWASFELLQIPRSRGRGDSQSTLISCRIAPRSPGTTALETTLPFLNRAKPLGHRVVMAQNLYETFALLERTPAALDALLRGLPQGWTNRDEGEGTFTVMDVVGHLIYADREDWLPRARRILEFGESKAFDPFNRLGHVAECRGKTLPQLLDEFAQVRKERLGELRTLNLQPEHMALRGLHPLFGAVTLSELLATWVAHDLTHLHQISRIMARQYRDEVGPFAAFLGVMKCNAHGG